MQLIGDISLKKTTRKVIYSQGFIGWRYIVIIIIYLFQNGKKSIFFVFVFIPTTKRIAHFGTRFTIMQYYIRFRRTRPRGVVFCWQFANAQKKSENHRQQQKKGININLNLLIRTAQLRDWCITRMYVVVEFLLFFDTSQRKVYISTYTTYIYKDFCDKRKRKHKRRRLLEWNPPVV